MINFQLANINDKKELSILRKKVWKETYTNIFNKEILENYDFEYHENKFESMINDKKYIVHKILKDNSIIGYLIYGEAPIDKFSKQYDICLYSLYILRKFQNQGIGSKAMEIVNNYCKENNVKVFYNGCNYYNDRAKSFYKKHGGKLFALDIGYEDKIKNQCYYRYMVQ